MKLFVKNTRRLKLLVPVVSATAAIFISSCSVHTHSHSDRSHKRGVRNEKKIPPGQHKKMHGDKSAKNYTPGHQKGKKKH